LSVGVQGRIMSSMRVVSLVPSATETLLEWDVEPVAVTRFCEQPRLPAVGGTKDPDLEAIISLRPDLVVMCVEENRREDAETLEARGLRVHPIDIDTVDDVASELHLLADALEVRRPLIEEPAHLPPLGLTAFVPIWRRPWMTVGRSTYASSLLERIGVETVPRDGEDRYPAVELTAAVAAGPDLVIAPDEPYPFGERHRDELNAVAPVLFVDGKDLLWWGTRTPEACARLRSVVLAGATRQGSRP
jgi:ABC-type Fe3+-hydroxamate transport system substrate-binding protein